MKTVRPKRDPRQDITLAYGILILTVFLFYCGPQGYQQISGSKFHLLCLLSGGYIAVMLLYAIEEALVSGKKLPSPGELLRRSSWTQRLIAVYLALTWLSALCSPYWPQTVLGVSRYEGALSITLYCLSFLLVSAYGRADWRLLAVLGGAASLFCLLCLAQAAGANPFGLYPAGYGYADAGTAYPGAYLGTTGNVDLTAAFLSLVIPIFLYSLLRLTDRRRFLLLIPLALALAVLVRMWVLAGLVGVGAGCLLALPIAGSAVPRRRRALAVLSGAAVLAGLAAVWLLDPGSGLFHELHQLLHGNFDPSFGSGRLHIWAQVLQALPGHLLLGAGPDTMALAGLEGFTRYDPALGALLVGQIDAAHNEYLNVLYHQGVFALAAWLAALILLARRWVRSSRRDPASAILGAGVLCYCIQAFFGFSSCVTAPFFWLALALLEKSALNKIEKGASSK